MEEFARHEGLSLGLVTKSDLIVRDLDLLQQISARNRLSIHITITTTNTNWRAYLNRGRRGLICVSGQ